MSSYEQFFRECDKDGNGEVCRKEFEDRMKRGNVSQQKIDEFFTFCDLDGNGIISYDEFMSALTKNNEADKWRRVFNGFDKDHSGYLEASEFEPFLRGIGLTEKQKDLARRFVKQHDDDGDGKISFNEFLKFLNVKSC
ncbi:16 kDa calcium-binding protein-like [Tubulanus polymorphus]|uniref:16 kDa calcium-binding protein-like n=1 Tax=Tubulanus polymorphus TaxID=672921 RepID=UPI003DA23819